jgi:hypothetical protein
LSIAAQQLLAIVAMWRRWNVAHQQTVSLQVQCPSESLRAFYNS